MSFCPMIHERVKIIEFGFFCSKDVYMDFDPNAQRLTNIKPNEIFNDFAISSNDEIFQAFFILKQ